jgi:CcmD family protein
MSKLGFLFTAYLLIWIVLAGYLLSLFTRQRRIDRELLNLQEQLKRRS